MSDTDDREELATEWASELEQAEVSEDDPNAEVPNAADLGVIVDIPVRVSMEVGNTQLTIGRLLKLTRGSVVELNRQAGEPLDVLVNGTLIAHGEVVMVNEKFALRLTDVVSPTERLKNL